MKTKRKRNIAAPKHAENVPMFNEEQRKMVAVVVRESELILMDKVIGLLFEIREVI